MLAGILILQKGRRQFGGMASYPKKLNGLDSAILCALLMIGTLLYLLGWLKVTHQSHYVIRNCDIYVDSTEKEAQAQSAFIGQPSGR
jgi:hypothetical protein